MFCRGILVNKTPDDILRIIELIETVTEQRRLLEMLDMCLSTFQLVELNSQGIEDATDTRMVCKHHSTDLVLRRYIGTLLSQSNLDGGGAPRDKVG